MSEGEGTARWWWAVAPSAELAGVARALEAGADPPGAQPIKAGARRAVWALPGVAGGLLVKRFEVRGAERWKYALLASRARSEYRAMEALVRLGLPVVRPVGHGERRAGLQLRQAWFVGRLVPGARTLADELLAAAQRPDAQAAQRWARAALDLVLELHRHPWLHRDLHAGNLLVERSGRLLLTDLHSVWRVPRLTRGMRLSNLARLLFSLRGALDLREAPALARRYAEARGEDADALVRDLLRALQRFEADYVRGRVARCLQPSSLFEVQRVDGGRVFLARGYGPGALSDELAMHRAALQAGGAAVLGRALRSAVTRVGEPGAGRVLKEYGPAGVLPALRQALGLGRARSAWVGARRCAVLGLPTPAALALLERRDGRAVLVTQALAGGASLRDLLPEVAASPRRRAQVARGLGHLLGCLARHGVRHHDLSAKNVFLAPIPAGAAPRDVRDRLPHGCGGLWLIDLDGLRRMPPHDPRGLARMLAQLGDLACRPSRTDRLRFARACTAAAGRDLPPSVVERAERTLALRRAARAAAASARPAG
jgi:tRNA A-37 threonylcarbamoyl transferase component Bud32